MRISFCYVRLYELKHRFDVALLQDPIRDDIRIVVMKLLGDVIEVYILLKVRDANLNSLERLVVTEFVSGSSHKSRDTQSGELYEDTAFLARLDHTSHDYTQSMRADRVALLAVCTPITKHLN